MKYSEKQAAAFGVFVVAVPLFIAAALIGDATGLTWMVYVVPIVALLVIALISVA